MNCPFRNFKPCSTNCAMFMFMQEDAANTIKKDVDGVPVGMCALAYVENKPSFLMNNFEIKIETPNFNVPDNVDFVEVNTCL